MQVIIQKIDPKNLPTTEVLAISERYDSLVGYIGDEDGEITCESDESMLEGVAYYIDLDTVINLIRESEVSNG